MIKMALAAAILLASSPVHAQVFVCLKDNYILQFKIEDGKWYQRPNTGYSWRNMDCGGDEIKCEFKGNVHSYRKTVSATSYSREFIDVKSGVWKSEYQIGSEHIVGEGVCAIDHNEN